MGALKDLPIGPWIHQYNTKIYLETGLGLATGIMRAMQCEFGFKYLFSIELDKDLVDHSTKTFKFDNRIQLLNMKSIDGLQMLLPQIPLQMPIFAFLDAHFMASDYHINDRPLNKHSDGEVSIRLPLWEELQLWKRLRTDNGARDLIVCDDVFLYSRDDHFEDNVDRLGKDAVPDEFRDYLPKFIDLFKDTHKAKIIYEAQGTLVLFPK